MSEPSKDVDEIHQIIDNMQARLVELFDQLRELRTHLDHRVIPVETGSVLPLFSKVNESPIAPVSITTPVPEKTHSEKETSILPDTKNDTTETISPSADEASPPSDVRVSHLLDPITHELRTGDSPAEVIAEYLQSAKDELITTSTPNEKVSRDMDIVLKFLRARGRRSIRPEERDNILRRIKRWQVHLVK
ncbi:MAG: hypothetical protein P1Q69_00755 [Candidatus Thorarchaeota archaeon]|nr:hypothetical protein [Candidatus Thorarchaeota archaeon]